MPKNNKTPDKLGQNDAIPDELLNQMFLILASKSSDKTLFMLPVVCKQWRRVVENGGAWFTYVSKSPSLKHQSFFTGKEIPQRLLRIRTLQNEKEKLERKLGIYQATNQHPDAQGNLNINYLDFTRCFIYLYESIRDSRYKAKMKRCQNELETLIKSEDRTEGCYLSR